MAEPTSLPRRASRVLLASAAVAALWLALPPVPASGASFPASRGRGGAVAAPEKQATDAGLEVLARGGNAADVMVATALATAVVHPQAGNLGGGGFAVVRFGDEITTLDFRETAPAAAHRDMYLDENGKKVPDSSIVGPLAAGIPGTPTGLEELHRKFGKLPWKEVVEPARRLAAEGFRVTRRLNESLEAERELLSTFPETASVWLPGGEPPAVGSVKRLPELAESLAAYGEQGAAGLTTGPVAAAILAAVKRHGGILTAEDLAGYRPVWREPVRFSAFGWEFASMDLPSSGGIILGQTFGMLERLGWAELPRFGADRVHLLAEVWRRAFADRFLLGDPANTRATVGQLLDPERLDRQAAGIDRSRARPSSEVVPGDGLAAAESLETTHLAVVDGDGNIVSLTFTLNGTFGCGLVAAGAGFFLNNEMDDFATDPGQPNMYGLIQGEGNEVAPGRRILSSMSPTIAWRGGEALAAGGRGGSRIPTATGLVLLNAIVDGDPLQTAVDRPRVHHQWLPDEISIEADALSPETRRALEDRGHQISVGKIIAKVLAVRLLADGEVEAAGDPRGPASGGAANAQP